MSILDPPKDVEAYLNLHSGLRKVYRQTGYNRLIDEKGRKLVEKIYNRVKKEEGLAIEECLPLLKKILNNNPPEMDLDQHLKLEDFWSKLKTFRTKNPKAVSFIESFWGDLAELEKLYKAEWNPLSERLKQRVLHEITTLKEFFIEGVGIEDEVWGLKDTVNSIFNPVFLEEDFGNKKQEFDSVVNVMLQCWEWGSKKETNWNTYKKEYMEGELAKAAKLYVESTWMHHPVLTRDLLKTICGFQILPLEEAEKGRISGNEKLVWVLLVTIGVFYFYPSIGGPLFFLILLFLFLSIFLEWKNKKKLLPLKKFYSEIANEGYDGEEIARRLHTLEKEGVIFPSIVYSLLRMKHKPSSIWD